LEVARKTLVRDFAYMRDRLDLPIAFDAVHNTYRYTEPVDAFPTVKISEGEVFSLLIAQKALEQYRGTSFHRQLAASFEKLTAALKDTVSFAPSEEMQSVSFKQVGVGKADAEIFNALSRAVVRKFEVAFDYRKPGSAAVEQRHVRPYHLSNRQNLWYLVAFDIDRGAMRTFAVPRIANLSVSTTKFQRDKGFSAEKFFSKALGVVGGDGRNIKVVIRFTARSADRIREREWHESQKLRDLPNGAVELTLTLGALEEIEGWVLEWGSEAEVLEPPELRERLRATVSALAKIYG
jgi:proteasome accessory factor B